MHKLNEHLQQLYNCHANLIGNASYIVGNINPNISCSSASTSSTIDVDEGVDSFAVWSILSSKQTTTEFLMNLNSTRKSRRCSVQRNFYC